MGHAFDGPYQIFVDSARILCLFLAAVRVGLTAACWLNYQRAERVLAAGIVVACVSISETEWDHVGSGVGQGGRLWLNLLAVTLFLVWRRAGAVWHHHATRVSVVAGER